MDLYGDLPAPKTQGEEGRKPDTGGWSSHAKLFQPAAMRSAQAAAAAAQQAKAAGNDPAGAMVEETEEGAAKRSSSLVPASLRPRAPKPRPAPPARAKKMPVPGASAPPPAKKPLSAGPAPSSLGSFSAVENEYDPARPNDYEEFCRERDAKAIADARQRELAKQMEASQDESRRARAEFAADPRAAMQRAQQEAAAVPRGGGRGRGMTLPAWMTQGGDAGGAGGAVPAGATEKPVPAAASHSEDAPTGPAPGPAPESGPGAAFIPSTGRGRGRGGSGRGGGRGRGRGGIGANIMAKMGYQEGEGLGRGGRGTTAPLQAVPLGGGQGRIVDRGGATQTRKRAAPTAPPGPAGETNVLLLMNLVPPGGVDDDLEGEVKQECAGEYGPVERCYVYEAKGPGVDPTKAVRVFLRFASRDSAVRAHQGLDGRFFDKRRIEARFFDEQRFADLDFQLRPGEL